MRLSLLSAGLILLCLNLYADPYKPKPHSCKTHYCSNYDWEKGYKRFDPLTIMWPLHYTGQTLKDKIDGGTENIDVIFKDHYNSKERLSLYEFRKDPACPDPHYLNKGIDMDQGFECEDHAVSKPRWKYADCSMILSSYRDRVIGIPGSACYKKIRDWTVLDWCTYEPNTGADHNSDYFELVKDLVYHTAYYAFSDAHHAVNIDGYYSYTQIIKVSANSEPTLVECTDEIVMDIKSKCEDKINLKNMVVSNGPCGHDVVSVTLYIYAESGDLVSIKKVNTATNEEFNIYAGTLAKGKYKLEWRVKDGCNNSSLCVQTLNVKSGAAPSLLCISNISTSISDAQGAKIWAKDFVLKSDGTCDNTISTFSFDKTEVVSSLTFTCDDGVGFQDLTIYSTDDEGNQSSCNTQLFISDHFVCSDEMSLAGILTNRYQEPLNFVDVNVIMTEQIVAEGLSNEKGEYSVVGIPLEKTSPYIMPQVNDERMDGINALDLIVLLQHLTGIVQFDDVLDYAAADINTDAQIDLDDYWALAGLIYELPNKQVEFAPWKFIDKRLYDGGVNRASKLTIPIPVRRFRHRYDIMGLKTGDINFSLGQLKSRPRSMIDMSYGTTTSNGTSTITIGDNGNSIGIQAMDIFIEGVQDANELTILTSAISRDKMIVSPIKGGVMISVLLYNSTTPSNEILIVNSKSSIQLSTSKSNIYTGDSDNNISKNPVNWTNNDVADGNKDLSVIVTPNPFGNQISVRSIANINGQNLSVVLFNAAGVQITSRQFVGNEGTLSINSELESGLYIIQTTYNGQTNYQKAIKTN